MIVEEPTKNQMVTRSRKIVRSMIELQRTVLPSGC